MILVTGGAGFIGSSLIEALNENNRKDIIVVDRLGKSDKWKNLRPLSYAEFIHADDLFTPEYAWALKNLDSIFHMGACSSTTERDVDFLMKNNVEFSKKIWRVAIQTDAKLIYASSAATYGDGGQGYDDHHEHIQDLRPLNPYGYSKQIFDLWALSQIQKPQYWYGLKFFNVYGANEFYKGEMRSMLHQAFEQIKDCGTVKLFKSHRSEFKDGEQKRDFIYVKDAVQAMLNLEAINYDQNRISAHNLGQIGGKQVGATEACWKPRAGSDSVADPQDGLKCEQLNGIYNMGTGQARTFFDLVSNIFKAMELSPRIEFIDMPLSLRNQYQYYTQAKMQKYCKLCPQHSFFTLEEGVRDCVQNHLL